MNVMRVNSMCITYEAIKHAGYDLTACERIIWHEAVSWDWLKSGKSVV